MPPPGGIPLQYTLPGVICHLSERLRLEPNTQSHNRWIRVNMWETIHSSVPQWIMNRRSKRIGGIPRTHVDQANGLGYSTSVYKWIGKFHTVHFPVQRIRIFPRSIEVDASLYVWTWILLRSLAFDIPPFVRSGLRLFHINLYMVYAHITPNHSTKYGNRPNHRHISTICPSILTIRCLIGSGSWCASVCL